MKRNMAVSTTCLICGLEEEDTFHVFYSCPNARQLWNALLMNWSLPPLQSISTTGEDWFSVFFCNLNEEMRVLVLLLFWRMWYVRNEIVHSKPAPPVDVSKRFLSSYLDTLYSISADPFDSIKGKAVTTMCFPHVYPACNNRPQPADILWSRPVIGRNKLNVDGSFLNNEAGAGMVLRDHECSIVFSACR